MTCSPSGQDLWHVIYVRHSPMQFCLRIQRTVWEWLSRSIGLGSKPHLAGTIGFQLQKCLLLICWRLICCLFPSSLVASTQDLSQNPGAKRARKDSNGSLPTFTTSSVCLSKTQCLLYIHTQAHDVLSVHTVLFWASSVAMISKFAEVVPEERQMAVARRDARDHGDPSFRRASNTGSCFQQSWHVNVVIQCQGWFLYLFRVILFLLARIFSEILRGQTSWKWDGFAKCCLLPIGGARTV